jgi:D-alanine-D-alanine ligase
MASHDITVLHQGRPGSTDPTVVSAWETQGHLITALRALGHAADSLFLDAEFEWATTLARRSPDLVFNAADLGLRYDIVMEPNIAAVLEGTGLPFTGSGAYAGALSGDKYSSKVLLRALGVPVPECHRLDQLPPELPMPVILKPRHGHNSLGMTAASVFVDRPSLEAEARRLQPHGRRWVVEAYIDGDEAQVAFVGNQPRRLLPQSTITFGPAFDGGPRILDYSAKWEPDSAAFRDSTPEPARYGQDLQRRIDALLERVAEALDVRDYGRCDVRLRETPSGLEPLFIDINTNPDLHPSAGLARMAAAGGLSYAALLGQIVDAANARQEARL